MNKSELKQLEKILISLKTNKSKFVTAEHLSQQIGIVPEAIQALCANFNPIVTIDFSFDLKELIPEIETFLEVNLKTRATARKTSPSKKKPLPYRSVIEFVYDRMTTDGIVDKSRQMSDAELRLLKRVATEELKVRKIQKKSK